MIQFDDCHISQLSIMRLSSGPDAKIWNKTTQAIPDADEQKLIKKLLLKQFSAHTTSFEFAHEVNLEYNVLFDLSKKLFDGAALDTVAEQIAQHLLSVSKHPNINEGELFIAQYSDLNLGERHYQALGIYKYEDKESFLETVHNQEKLELQFRKGLNSKKAEKACLILCTDEPYTLLVIDSNNSETEYWQNEFIKHKPKNDHFNNTGDFLTLAKTFITEQIPQEYDINKTDQLSLLNRSVDYFKKHETFDRKEFEEEVFEDKGIIKSFRSFDQNWQQENDLEIGDQFEIAAQVVKKQARAFKSVLKLDKNFHIYIHGDRDLIEQGIDKDGRKFYKIYYDNES